MQSIKEVLWSQGISGDMPIITVIVKKYEDTGVIESLIKAHEYFSTRGLKVDFVIIDNEEVNYNSPLFNTINEIIELSHLKNMRSVTGGVFLLRGEAISKTEISYIKNFSNILFEDGEMKGNKKNDEVTFVENNKREPASKPQKFEREELEFFNGIGGFNNKNEYIAYLSYNNLPPMPWSNIIANEKIGAVLTETGGGFSWYRNSREFRITPFNNDVVEDRRGEIIYIKDEETGEIFTPYFLPCPKDTEYRVKYGLGYVEYRAIWEDKETILKIFVPKEDGVKVSLLEIKNKTDKVKKFSIFYYIEPVLLFSNNKRERFIKTSYSNNKIEFINSFEKDFVDKKISMTGNDKVASFCLSKEEFFGNGKEENPELLCYKDLKNIEEYILPVGVIQTRKEISSYESASSIFLLGEEKYFNKYMDYRECEDELLKVSEYFKNETQKIKVTTPNKAMNILLNGFLLYQTLVCRIIGRSAFYQSGGAFGFRDQLQDSISLLYTMPEITRKQILIHASRQFRQGDVLHWWHEEGKKGTRTKFSDDLLWLVLATCEYILVTKDYQILEEEISFVEAEELSENEDERYIEFIETADKKTLYEHCILAIERAYKLGEHGLMLMGSGDWNDGMNKVGNKGKGESVWLSWFMYKILTEFAPICKMKGDDKRAYDYLKYAFLLSKNTNENAWDGKWYKRAFFDDGKEIGTIQSDECKIDSIAQSWSVISRAGEEEKSRIAIGSAQDYLIDVENGIIKLLTPPFGDSDIDPGYIKLYPKGIRENGGQYTHGAIWLGIAFAMLEESDMAYEIFDILNPINHTRTDFEVRKYKTEPYVMTADIYTNSIHMGRGGWSWYTGASGWMYQFGIRYLLGFQKRGDTIILNPLFSKSIDKFEIEYKFNKTVYKIQVMNNIETNKEKLVVDGVLTAGNSFELVDDGNIHFVEGYFKKKKR